MSFWFDGVNFIRRLWEREPWTFKTTVFVLWWIRKRLHFFKVYFVVDVLLFLIAWKYFFIFFKQKSLRVLCCLVFLALNQTYWSAMFCIKHRNQPNTPAVLPLTKIKTTFVIREICVGITVFLFLFFSVSANRTESGPTAAPLRPASNKSAASPRWPTSVDWQSLVYWIQMLVVPFNRIICCPSSTVTLIKNIGEVERRFSLEDSQ